MATAMTPAKPAAETKPARREPFEFLDTLQEEMARLWGQTWPWPTMRPFKPAQMATAWAPRVDMFERNGRLVVKAELPGVEKEDISVALDQGDLEIRGERKTESEVKEEDFYRMERSYGSFFRRLPLPFEVKPEAVAAEFKDGVLEISIKKPAESKPAAAKIDVT